MRSANGFVLIAVLFCSLVEPREQVVFFLVLLYGLPDKELFVLVSGFTRVVGLECLSHAVPARSVIILLVVVILIIEVVSLIKVFEPLVLVVHVVEVGGLLPLAVLAGEHDAVLLVVDVDVVLLEVLPVLSGGHLRNLRVRLRKVPQCVGHPRGEREVAVAELSLGRERELLVVVPERRQLFENFELLQEGHLLLDRRARRGVLQDAVEDVVHVQLQEGVEAELQEEVEQRLVEVRLQDLVPDACVF
mmetsp:Transcript_43545/g.51260  ORF Transcript_43545/g.51260 Transcript_43545/m.51260 type:complete len:247 (-) Transcript_43545:739-1479(-)